MASTTLYLRSGPMSNGFSPLAIVGYAVLAILLSFVSLRIYRYLKLKSQARTSLPKPVSGSTHKSAFNLGRSSGWDWRRWSLPRVPGWPKVPDVMGKAKLVANAKNLTVELLPTTGLPPPPTSVTTPMPDTSQLVDLSTPATPPLTTASTSGSFQTSPRTPSPFMHHTHPSKPLYPTTTYASYSRSPSPHAFLATSPQKGHRRSKSLGGVPIRRLSSGTSGLRHAMEMQEFSANHVRGTSREHLLIDFTSSGSSDEDDIEGGFTKISPAASDIGVLPLGKEIPPRVDARTVGRHVPLVDLGDEDSEDLISSPRPLMKVDDDSWKLFGLSSNIPALPFTRFSRSSDTESKLVSHNEQSVDSKNERRPEVVLGSDSIDVRHLDSVIRRDDQAFVGLNNSSKTQSHKEEEEEEEEEEKALIDLQDDFLEDEDPFVTSHPLLSSNERERQPAEVTKSTSIPFPKQSPILVKAHFSHPLETLVNVEILQPPVYSSSDEVEDGVFNQKPSLLFQREYMPSDQESQDLKINASPALSEMAFEPSAVGPELEKSSLVSNLPLAESATPAPSPDIWTWEEQDGSDDPWANHISDISPSRSPTSPDSETFVYTGHDLIVQEDKLGEEDLIAIEEPISPDASDVFVYDPEMGVLEKSPGATLFATELVDEEEGEMPALDLGGISVQSNVSSEVSETNLLDEEEELTPKPTPASVELMLPALLVESVDENIVQGSLSPVDVELDSTYFADPELLPLPDSPLLLMLGIPDPETPSLMFEKDERLEKSTPSQTPTPPASPPPISPLRALAASNISLWKSPAILSDKSQGTISRFGISPTPGLTLVVGRSPKNSDLRDLEDKENMTPTAFNTTVSEPIWETKHDDVLLAPPISRQIPRSPPLSRRILVDVTADANGEEDNTDNELNKETTLLSSSSASMETQASQNEIHRPEHSSLPGTFPELGTGGLKPSPEVAASTVGARLALSSNTLKPRPSARALVRSPLEIALAMQLRPGLGAGADPAWMVRFLMTMFGWFAVVVSGQAEF